MSKKPNDKVIENFCVYDHSNKSFSYLKVKKREIKKEKYENEYEKLVNRKCMYNYEWIKNLSYKECIDYIIQNSFKNLKKKIYVKKYGKIYVDKYKKNISSLCSTKQNEECCFINNKKFLKEAKNIKNAVHCINKNKGKYKPQLFVDKICKIKNRYEDIIYKHEDMIREEKFNDHDGYEKKKVITYDDNNNNMNNMMNMIKMKDIFEEAYSHPFDILFRKKYYEKICRLWLKNFVKKNGKVHKKLAKKLIKCLIIKNFIIFDVELWNIFLKKNIMNHFNTNLYFLTGKIGNMKTVFLNDLFLTFPFFYKNDHMFMIDISDYENYTIVCDYRYLMDPMYLNTNKNYNIKKKKKKKKNLSSFKMCNTLDDIKNKEKYSKLINLQIYNDLFENNKHLYEERNYNNVDIANMKHDNIMSIDDSLQSDSSYELINFKTNQFKKQIISDDQKYNDNYKKKLYVQKVLYPYYYELILKEKLITDINIITSYDPLNFNLEYILIHFTRQAMIKQYVWKRKMYKWLTGIFNKSQGEHNMKKVKIKEKEKIKEKIKKKVFIKNKVYVNHKSKNDDDENFYMNKQMNMNLGLDLFNGGISFLLIKNIEYINNFPTHKKNCIIFLLLKYIFMWKNMNLNAHMFIISSSSSISANSNNHSNNNTISNIKIYNNSSDNISSLFNRYMNNYFVFVFPNFLHTTNRYELLIHLFKKYKLYYCENEIKELAKITNNFNIDNIIKLFEDEYRERIIDHLKKKKTDTSQEIITKNSCYIKDIFEKARKGKNQFFSKTLNLQHDSHIYIHMHEIEMYKKKKYEMFSKNGIFENYGFNEVIGEEKLISNLKNQIVSKFNMQESKNIGLKKIHMCDIEGDNIKANGIDNIHDNNKIYAASSMVDNICNFNQLDTVGILLHGKSGSGKSFIAKKIVEECNCNSVIINCSNIFNKIMGESEKFLNEIFEYCIKKLQPCIILFDNIETICYKEDYTFIENFNTRLKLCFYENIDKIHYEKKWKRNPCLLLIIATTNDINNIDDNLLRNYRFKYIYQTTHFQYWKEQDIYKLFYKCLKSNNIESTDFLYSHKFKQFVDEHIIKVQYKLSPLYIYNLCTYALTYRLRNALKGNENELDVEDFYESIKRMMY
ncbi:AAA family ATPase,putative [Plasmodium gaboni]|uniref:AAA family ATPase,putative n=1 Tax=Plasmodium gaboni TaxID=647221 RepID=A0ABY1ULD3_9APIC|nr:AAA family ATPase,putative [Plasmodium gaboni]